jgi:hypothetical protein
MCSVTCLVEQKLPIWILRVLGAAGSKSSQRAGCRLGPTDDQVVQGAASEGPSSRVDGDDGTPGSTVTRLEGCLVYMCAFPPDSTERRRVLYVCVCSATLIRRAHPSFPCSGMGLGLL